MNPTLFASPLWLWKREEIGDQGLEFLSHARGDIPPTRKEKDNLDYGTIFQPVIYLSHVSEALGHLDPNTTSDSISNSSISTMPNIINITLRGLEVRVLPSPSYHNSQSLTDHRRPFSASSSSASPAISSPANPTAAPQPARNTTSSLAYGSSWSPFWAS